LLTHSLKDFRRLSLRLDKTDTSFRAFTAFAAAILKLAAEGKTLSPDPIPFI
jgi:hypothetical protein